MVEIRAIGSDSESIAIPAKLMKWSRLIRMDNEINIPLEVLAEIS
jgi:hypothetical protein